MKTTQVGIIGGGIAGLVAAAMLARRGIGATLFESAPTLGGRARTRVVDGFHFNQGPHALYLAGAFNRTLTDLGLSAQGDAPRLRGGLALWGDEVHPLPRGSARTVAPLSASDCACLAETFARIAAGDYDGEGAPLRVFTGKLPQAVRMVLEAWVRLSSYAHAPEEIDGKAALDQFRLSFAGARYVDGGWGSLIAKLADSATIAGAVLKTGQRVGAVRRNGPIWQVEAAGKVAQSFESIVLAVPPAVAHALVEGSSAIAEAAQTAQPLRAMCLDIGLVEAESGAEFALGMDAPTYLSLHSSAANLAPPRAGLLHLSRYLAPDEAPHAAHFDELERFADRLRPGWREHIAHKQRLVGIDVAHDYPRRRRGGRRAPVVVSDAPGLFLAGDWIGEEGMLSDAAAASAVLAAQEASAFLAGVTEAPMR
jgi:phytoene dehydrogenase-like protein